MGTVSSDHGISSHNFPLAPARGTLPDGPAGDGPALAAGRCGAATLTADTVEIPDAISDTPAPARAIYVPFGDTPTSSICATLHYTVDVSQHLCDGAIELRRYIVTNLRRLI